MTTPDTEDVEHLLELDNVVGVDVHPDGTVRAFVSQKLPESELPDDQIVSNAADEHETDVIESGSFRALSERGVGQSEAPAPEMFRRKHRPIPGGISEGQRDRRSAGTSGPLAVRTDEDVAAGIWHGSVQPGDLVRISNNHVYAGTRYHSGEFGDAISQPATLDSGVKSNVVGQLIGYVPLADGVNVDCAARTADRRGESPGYFGLSPAAGRAVYRGEQDYQALLGASDSAADNMTLTKAGRTTGVQRADVVAVNASVQVGMGGERTVLFRNQIITGDMSKPGDSGSPVTGPAPPSAESDEGGVTEADDEGLVGLLFAGSDRSTVVNRIENVEQRLGVRFGPPHKFPVTEPEPEPDPEPAPDPEPDPEVPPDREEQIIKIGRGNPREKSSPRTFAFSMGFSGDMDVTGRSSTVVGQRVNGWVAGWSNTYRLRGHLTDVSIPDRAQITINDKEVTPDELLRRSQELADTEA